MDIVTAADTGVVKGITLSTHGVVNYGDLSALKPKEDGITCMSWTGDDQTEILCASLDRKLRLFDCIASDEHKAVKAMFPVTCGSGDIKSALTYNNGRSIAVASNNGTIGLHDLHGAVVGEWESGANLLKMRRRDNIVVTCGDEHAMKLWDLSTAGKGKASSTWTSKNVAHDWLQLRVTVCDNDVRFVPRSQLIVTCTKTKQIRKYDPRAQRRPVAVMTSDSDYPLMCLDVADHDGMGEHRVIAGDTQGRMAVYDWRGKAGLTHVFRSFAGACRDIVCHPSLPVVASCSLDRFVRVHHIDNKTLIDKIYCKTRLTCVLMRDRLSIVNEEGKIVRAGDATADKKEEEAVKDEGAEEGSDDEDGGEDVWESIGRTNGRSNVVEEEVTPVVEEDEGEDDLPVKKRRKKNVEGGEKKKSKKVVPEVVLNIV